MKGLFKIIFQEENYCINLKLCLQGDETNGFQVLLTHDLFNTIFWGNLLYQLEALSPGRPGQWMCKAESSLLSLTNAFSRPSLKVKLSYLLKALSLGKHEQQICRGFPVSVVNGLFRTIFWEKLSYQFKAQVSWVT